MLQIPDHVRQVLVTLVPAAVINEISCFKFYDNHPRDLKNLDVILCTLQGELKEYYNRELVCSALIEDCGSPSNIILYRNTKDNGLRYSHRDDETLPVLTQLMTKLTEAKYSVKCNERAYHETSSLRQIAAYAVYQETMADFEKSLFTDEKSVSQDQKTLKIKTQKPWVKVSNGKIVIIVEVLNTHEVPITDVHILLESDTKLAITYTTKIFKSLTESPFWCEQTQTLNPNMDTAVVAIIDQNELQYNVTCGFKFTGIISYKLKDKEQILPLENIYISALDTMGEEFDVLYNITEGNSNIRCNVLAVLSTTKKIDLFLRHIQEIAGNDVNIMDAFCQYLLMKRIPETNNIVIHRHSPCHMLNGVMIVLQASGEGTGTELGSLGTWILSVHTRSPSQVLALMHYIHDAIPHRIVVTTTNYRLTARSQLYSHRNEDVSTHITTPNYFEYGASILKQTTAILKYFDECMIKMNDSKDPVVQSKIGREIDVFVGGVENFLKFRKEVLDCGLEGVNSVVKRSEGDEGVVVCVD